MIPKARGLELSAQSIGFSVAGPGDIQRMVLSIEALKVGVGEKVALCGPSGSGKTTLLNVLVGLKSLPGAQIVWSGVELRRLSSSQQDRWRRENVGIVFQQFHLHPKLSPLDNVLLTENFGSMKVGSAVRSRARDLLDRLRVPQEHNIELLSRGESQRVALARAFLRRPRLLIADEPTASLDLETARASLEMLMDLCTENGTTAIVATHDHALAASLDRRIDLRGGQLRAA